MDEQAKEVIERWNKTMSLAWYVLLLKKVGVKHPRVWRDALQGE